MGVSHCCKTIGHGLSTNQDKLYENTLRHNLDNYLIHIGDDNGFIYIILGMGWGCLNLNPNHTLHKAQLF